MEAAGLVIGTVALASLFNNALDCFDYIQAGRSFSRDFQTNLLKLDDVRLRLSRWGQSVGLSDHARDDQAIEQLSGSLEYVEQSKFRLEQILELFADAERISTRVKSSRESGPADTSKEADAISESTAVRLHRKMRELALKRQNRTGLRQRAKWALYEEKHLRRLIEDVSDLVNGLTDLFPATKHEQQTLCEKEVAEMDRESLPVLREAIAGQDGLLEEAIAKVLNDHHSEHVVFSGSHNAGFQLGFNRGTISGLTFMQRNR